MTGTVVSSALRPAQRLDDDDQSYDVWLPTVSYRYAAAGGQHEGKRAFWFDREFTDQAEAERWLAGCPSGSTATVFYDPAHPGRSALALNEPSAAPGSGFIWLGGALVIGAVLAPAFGGQ